MEPCMMQPWWCDCETFVNGHWSLQKITFIQGHLCSVWALISKNYVFPVDGGWSDYGAWSACSVECGGGKQTRKRKCNNPAPENGGAECQGVSVETRSCNKQACPVDGGWSDYGAWSACSVECGGGQQTRERKCNNPAPENGGAECQGESVETRSCNEDGCVGKKLKFLTKLKEGWGQSDWARRERK